MPASVAIRVEASDLLAKLLDTFGWVVQSIAWPVATVLVVLMLRREIHALMKRLRKGRWGDAEFDFDQRVDEIAAQHEIVEMATASAEQSAPANGPPAADDVQEQPAPASGAPERASELSEAGSLRPPPADEGQMMPGVIKPENDNWPGTFERHMHLAPSILELTASNPRAGINQAWRRMQKELRAFAPDSLSVKYGFIPPAVFKVLSAADVANLLQLKDLYDELVKNEDETPSVDAALSFIEMSDRIRMRLKSVRTAPPGGPVRL